MSSALSFWVAIASLVGTPLLAPVGAKWLHRQAPPRRVTCLRVLAAFASGVAIAVASGVSTRWQPLSLALAGAAFACAAVAGLSAFGWRPTWLGRLVGAATIVPLAASLLLGTVGFLGVAFIVGDGEPVHEEAWPDGRACQVTTFGNATTSNGGYDVARLRRPAWLPALQWSERTLRFDDPTFGPEEACRRAVAAGLLSR